MKQFNAKTNGFIIPVESTVDNGQPPGQDEFADGHALRVAGVMIGKPGAPTSVAPDARLYTTSFAGTFDNEVFITQYIAKRFPMNDPNRIRVINHSWGSFSFSSEGPFDGNSQLTLGMDWTARQFDVLHVIAGAEFDRAEEPTDNYNGLVVGSLAEEAGGGYLRVSGFNDNAEENDAAGDRVSVDLLAPGEGLTLATAGANNPVTTALIGTSYASPHVTGTVALLNQYGDHQVTNSVDRWDSDNTRKHEVMKAVLLNSADKMNGVHGSTRTILDEDGLNWEQKFAFSDDSISLDRQMGAGALNAERALKQFSSGEYNIGENIPKIGWDYGETAGLETQFKYPFSSTVEGYVAITLAWDRRITKNGGPVDTFTGTDTFTGNPVDNLNLYLVPKGWDSLSDDAVAKSVSEDDNVEHIFKSVPAGDYEIVVYQPTGDEIDFGLAWWAGELDAPILGDFNNDGRVDGADLTQWKGDFGGPGSDADGDGDSDGADFLTWQQNLGTGVPTAPASVPEPAGWILAVLGLAPLARRGREGRVLGRR